MFNFKSKGGFGMLYMRGARQLMEAEAPDLKSIADKLADELKEIVGVGNPVQTSTGYKVEYDLGDDLFKSLTNGGKKEIDLISGKYGGSAKLGSDGKLCVELTTDKVQQTNEASDNEKFIELNKGREGKTVIAITGKELPNSVYLGGTSYARKDGNDVILVRPTGPYGKSEMTFILKQEWDILKKSKL